MAKSVTRTYLNKVKSLLNDTNTNIKALSNALVEKGILDSSFKNKACTAGDILAGLAEYESWHPVLMSEDEEGAAIAEFDDINASGTAIKTAVVAEMPIKGYGKDGLTYIDPTNISEVYNSINNTTVATDRADGNTDIKRWTSRSIFKFLDIYYKYDRRKFEIPVKDIRNGLFLRKGNNLDGIVDNNGLSLYPYPEEIIMISEKKESNFIHFINAQYTDAHYGHFNGRNYNFMIVRDRERIGKLNSEGTGFETYLSVYANDVETELAYIDKKDDGEWYWNIPVPDKVYGEEMLDGMWDVRIVWRRDEPDRSFSVSYDLEVQEMSLLGDAVKVNSSLSNYWFSVCYGKDKFIAVPSAGESITNAFAYSSDGITWTEGELPSYGYWNSVCYGNDKFVIVKGNAKIFLYSSDGITWTQGTMQYTDLYQSVCYGKDKFVVVTSHESIDIYYSSDGIAWSRTTTKTNYVGCSVCYGKDKFVAVGGYRGGGFSTIKTDGYIYSSDGITWTQSTLPVSQGWHSICYGENKFVAVAESTNIFVYSSDGIAWTQGTLPVSKYWNSVCYGNDKFVAVSSSDIFVYSSDGITWTQSTLPSSRSWRSVCYGNGKFVVISSSNFFAYIQHIDISALDFDIIDDRVHLINESTENVATARNQVSNYAEYSGEKNIMYEPFLLNSAGNIVSGSKFENENKLVDIKMEFKATQGNMPISGYWNSVCYGKDKFVAIGDSAPVYSSDGITWTQGPTPLPPVPSTNGSDNTWTSICYGKDKFVAIAHINANVFAYSTDGQMWSSGTMPSTQYWAFVCYGKDKFVAIARNDSGISNVFAYSSDGITWTEGTLPVSNYWRSVCYGKDKYVAVGTYRKRFAYSSNGITWIEGTMPSNDDWYSVCYGKDKYVAVVNNSATHIFAYSTDGITWTQGTMPSKIGCFSVCYGKDKFVAVGPGYNIFVYSSDGITWTQGNLNTNKYRYSICYGKDKFVTVEGGNKSDTFEYLQDTLNNPKQIPTQIFKLSPDSPLLPNGYIGFSYRTDLANRGDINGFNKDDVLTGNCYIIFYDKNLQHIKTIDSTISGNGTDYMDLVYKKIGSETEFMLIANIVGSSKRYSQLCIDINCNIINTRVDNIIFDDISLNACYSEIKLGFYNKKWLHTYRLCINGIIDDKIDTDQMRLSVNEDAVKESSTISVATNINGHMVYPIEYLPILVGRENIITLSNSISANNISIHDYNTAWGDIAVNTNLHVIAQKRNYAIIEDTSGSKSIVKLIEKYTFDKELLANPTV